MRNAKVTSRDPSPSLRCARDDESPHLLRRDLNAEKIWRTVPRECGLVFLFFCGHCKKVVSPQFSEKIFETFPIGSGENK